MQVRRSWLAFLLALVVSVTGVVVSGYTVADLEAIVGNEGIPEISTAAGLALGPAYAAKSEAELRALAAEGRTIGIRTAAATALSIQWAKKTEAELMAIAGGTDAEIIRAAAIEPLQLYLVPKAAADLKKMAADAAQTHEVRLAAAKAYSFKTRATAKLAALEKAVVTNDSAELAYAAGEILAGFYLSFAPKTEEALVELAKNGTTQGQRVAGGVALVSFLLEKSAWELEVALVELTGWGSAEYRDAYTQALAVLYAK